MTLILFTLILGLVVIEHEFGQFLLAKGNGIHVVEFGKSIRKRKRDKYES